MGKVNNLSIGICFSAGVTKEKGKDVLMQNSLFRINHALELYKEGKIQKILCTGGIFSADQQIPIAILMQEYLKEKGVPEADIIIETESVETIENIKFTFSLLKDSEFFKKTPASEKIRLVFISEVNHLKRIEISVKAYLNSEGLSDRVDISFEPVQYQLSEREREIERIVYDKILEDPLGEGDFFEKVRQERRQG